jgi:hypothetical protein
MTRVIYGIWIIAALMLVVGVVVAAHFIQKWW